MRNRYPSGKKIRICCTLPHLIIGGMERVMSELANDFAARADAEVHLVLYGMAREIKYKLDDRIIVHQPNFEFDNRCRMYYTLKSMWWLRREIERIEPDAMLSFGEYWNNLVLLSCLGLRYPIYVSDRSEPAKDLGRVHNFLRRHLYKRASGIVCQTQKAKEITLSRHCYENVRVIGNPIRTITGTADRDNAVIAVGRMIETKHYDRLIRIFVGLQTDWKLRIVGGDAQRQNHFARLSALIKELNAEDRIELLGYRNDVDELLLRSKLFAFASSSEGFPNVIGEAMSAGLPVVAYDCIAGPSDMIEDGVNGYLIPLFDDATFGEKLLGLMENELLRSEFSDCAKSSIRRFSAQSICSQYFEFITGKSAANETDY